MSRMNPMLIILVAAVAFFSWHLWVSIRRGEFRYTSGGQMGARSYSHVRRSEQPQVFWCCAALHAGIILYIASIGFEL
jgi:hypothetical protein